jgi:hypothetical protein
MVGHGPVPSAVRRGDQPDLCAPSFRNLRHDSSGTITAAADRVRAVNPYNYAISGSLT